jgi:hypothetical protein
MKKWMVESKSIKMSQDGPIKNSHFLSLGLLEVTISWQYFQAQSDFHTIWKLYFIENSMYTVQAILSGSMAMLLQWIVMTTKFQYSVLDSWG